MPFALLFAVIPSDVAALSADEWSGREAAESRLRAYGPLAWPFLLPATSSDDPEMRFRAERLLVPYRSLAADARAWTAIRDPWPINPLKFYADRDLRERIRRLSILAGFTAGCPYWDCDAGWHGDWWVDALVPDEEWDAWNWDISKHHKAARALDAARAAFGNRGVGWPFSPR